MTSTNRHRIAIFLYLIQVLFFILLFSSNTSAQQEASYFLREDESAPAWVNRLYQENADPGEVMKLYKEYYRTHPFIKNEHTQYYKRWLSGLGRTVVSHPESDAAYLEKYHELKNQRTAAMWEPVGPIDWDHNAAGKSYAPGSAHVYTVEQSVSNPDILFAGTANAGIWKSVNRGTNWTPCTNDLLTGSITALEIHPTNPSIVYAGLLSSIYKSTNGGTSWQITGNAGFQSQGLQVQDIRCHPDEPNRVFAATQSGLFRSTDSGTNWTNMLSGDMLEVEFHPFNPDTIYVVRKEGMVTKFYRSLNGGNSFTQMTIGWPVPNTGLGEHQERTEIAVTPDAPNNIYALATGSADGGSGLYGVYMSTDLGSSWTFRCCGPGPGGPPSASNPNLMGWSDQGLDNGGQYYYDLAFAVSPYNKDSMWVCGVNLWVSSNEGSSFVCPSAWSHSYKPQYVHADIHDLHYMETTGELWLAGDGGIFYSEDRGENFLRRNVGILGTDFWGFGQGHWSGDVMLGGAYHNGTMLKEESVYLNGWICTDGGDGVGGYVNPGYDRQVYSWFNIKDMQSNRLVDPVTRDYYKQPNSTYITGASSDILFHPNYYGTWYSGSDTKLFRTGDNGFTFEEVHDFGVDVAAMDLCVSQPNVIYACTFPGWWDIKRIYRSDNAGESWTEVTPPESILNHPNDDWVPYDIAVSPDDPMEVFIVRTSMYSDYPGGMGGYTVYKSMNGGATWMNISSIGLGNEYPTCMIYQKGTNDGIYVGTRRSVFYKNATMTRWELFNTGLPARIHSAKLATWYRAGKLRNATDRSVWQTPFFESSQPIAIPAVQKDFFFCHRDTAYFTDLSVLSETNATWSWSFPGGSPATSTLRNPKVVYNIPGVYDVSLIIQDVNGTDTAVMQHMVTIDNKCKVDTTAGGKLHLTNHPDYVKVDDLQLTGNTFTISAWIKPDGIQSEYTGIIMNDGTAAGFNFREANNTLAYHWPGGSWSYDSNLAIPAGEWSYIAMVVQPTSVTLYVNGYSATHNTAIQSVTLNKIRIGSYQGWDTRNFKGDIDEVCIWNRALSQDEIRLQRHITKLPSADLTLKAYYQFDEQINSGFVIDKINGKDGMLNSGATIIASDIPVGSGTSQIKTISASGLAEFNNGGDMDISFGSTHPNGKVVVSHLRSVPDTMPANLIQQGGYYIINNYGANQNFTNVSSMTFKKCGSVSNDMATSIDFDLFKRNSNAIGMVWSDVATTNIIPTPALSSSITTSGLTGLTSFSQFIVMRDQVPTGMADVIITTPGQSNPVVTGGESISLLMHSDVQGLKLPVLFATTLQGLGIPSPGQLAFLSDSLALVFYNGNQWIKLRHEPILQTVAPADPNNNVTVSIPNATSGDAYMLSLGEGFLKLPIHTSENMLTIDAPAQGMVVYDSTIGKISVFNGSQWQSLSSVNTALPVSMNPSSQVIGIAINQNFKYSSSVLEISPAGGKALQLPVVKHEVIFNPVTGIVCFDPELRSVMIFDGVRWNQVL